MDFWWILSASLKAKLSKKSILIGNTEKSDFVDSRLSEKTKIKVFRGSTSSKNQ